MDSARREGAFPWEKGTPLSDRLLAQYFKPRRSYWEEKLLEEYDLLGGVEDRALNAVMVDVRNAFEREYSRGDREEPGQRVRRVVSPSEFPGGADRPPWGPIRRWLSDVLGSALAERKFRVEEEVRPEELEKTASARFAKRFGDELEGVKDVSTIYADVPYIGKGGLEVHFQVAKGRAASTYPYSRIVRTSDLEGDGWDTLTKLCADEYDALVLPRALRYKEYWGHRRTPVTYVIPPRDYVESTTPQEVPLERYKIPAALLQPWRRPR